MSPSYSRSKRAAAAVSLVAATLAACTPAATPTAAPVEPTKAPAAASDWAKATSAEAGGGMDALVAAAKAEGSLTVIALPHDWCNYGGALEGFKAKYGLSVTELNPDAGSGDELEAIRANKDSGGPQAPDVIDVGVAFGPQSKDEGLITAYKVATWDTIQDVPGAKDPDGFFYPDYGGVLVFQVNTDLVTNVPADWADLLKPEYKGQVGLSGDPRSSNQAAQTVYAAALANGGSLDNIQPGLDYFKQLNDAGNLLPVIVTSGLFAKGEAPISFFWNYLSLAQKETLAGNPPVEIVYPKSGAWGGWYIQAISAYAPHPAAARLWQEYLYSDEGQQAWMKGYCVPARLADLRSRNAAPQDLLDRMPPAGVIENAVIPSVAQLDAARAAIKDQWDKAVGLDIQAAP